MAGFGIDFGLLQTQGNPGNALMAGYQQGRAQRRQMETDRALAAHAQGDPDAIRRLAQFDPQLAAQLENGEYQRSERARAGEARGALSDYIVAGVPSGGAPRSQPVPGGALSGFAQPTSTLNTGGPPPTAAPGQSALGTYAPPAPAQTNALAAVVPGSPQAPQGVLAQAGARQPNALLPPGMYDAAPPAGGPAGPSPQSDPRQEAFTRLARADPETAMKVQKMDVEQRAAVAEALGKQLDIGGRVYSAVLQAPPEQQADVYRQLRVELETAGVIDLPDDWDPVAAKSRMRMGMTVLQAVGADDRVRRTEWDMRDDELDNERSDRDVDSRITDRVERRGITVRGQDRASADRRYSADRRGSGRGGRSGGGSTAPTPTRVIGNIMDRYARGEQLTPQESEMLNNYTTRSPRKPGVGAGGGGGGSGGAGRAGSSRANPIAISTPQAAEKLPKGTWFKASNGNVYQRQ